jgi:hypothetical protein
VSRPRRKQRDGEGHSSDGAGHPGPEPAVDGIRIDGSISAGRCNNEQRDGRNVEKADAAPEGTNAVNVVRLAATTRTNGRPDLNTRNAPVAAGSKVIRASELSIATILMTRMNVKLRDQTAPMSARRLSTRRSSFEPISRRR